MHTLVRFSAPGILCALLFPVLVMCNGGIEELLPYEPEVIFTGYFNGDYDSLTGNRQWRNTCRLVGDTIRIYCYSTFFSEVDMIRDGDLMRIDFFPDSGNGFEKRNTLFHLARYHGQNESYTVNRGDTADVTIRFESEVAAYQASTGADLELKEIFVSAPPVGQGRHLEITKGRLFGRVH